MIILLLLLGLACSELTKAEVERYFGKPEKVEDCDVKVLPYKSKDEGYINEVWGLVEKCCIERNVTNCVVCRTFKGQCIDKITYSP